MRIFFRPLAATALLCPLALSADPAPPKHSNAIARLDWGLFCAHQPMDQIPAPGTATGWIHRPEGPITFHWPKAQQIPASLGMGFGVEVTMPPGLDSGPVEIRVHRPGQSAPDHWDSGFSDRGPTLDFFRFDTEAELQPGLWVFEAVQRQTGARYYTVEFEVVPAASLPGIAGACDATS